MIALILAAAVVSAAPASPFELKLVCKGLLLDEQRSTVTHGGETANVSTDFARPGVIRVQIHGVDGVLLFDDGVKRPFKNADIQPTKITATYSRLMGLSKPVVEVDRITGEMTLTAFGGNLFRGSCELEPETSAKPKF